MGRTDRRQSPPCAAFRRTPLENVAVSARINGLDRTVKRSKTVKR
jgi:hypothetical protein